MLLVSLLDLPVLGKGKGNKLMALKKGGLGIADETLQWLAILPAGGVLTLHAGKRSKTFKAAELEPYRSERAKRGMLLPKGFHVITGLEISTN